MENKNEHEHIKEKYVERFGLYGVLGNDIDDKTIELVIANAHHFERPDICSVVENKVYGIEHFEFGPYIQKRKGSEYEIKHAGFKRELRKELAKTKSSVNKVGNLGVNASLLEYKENFLKNYNQHYSKIDDYLNNLQKEYINKNISIWFFVEDVGPFGTQIESKTGVHTVLPFEIKEIYDTIVESSKLDGIIYGTFDISRNSSIMIIASKESISKIYTEKNFIDINKPLICADPQIFASELLINK